MIVNKMEEVGDLSSIVWIFLNKRYSLVTLLALSIVNLDSLQQT